MPNPGLRRLWRAEPVKQQHHTESKTGWAEAKIGSICSLGGDFGICRTACLTMVFKLARCAEKHWRKLNGSDLLAEVIRGIVFVDGIREIAA